MGARSVKQDIKGRKKEPDLSGLPARVDNVIISGLGRTHDDYILKSAEGLFKATNFQEVVRECKNAQTYLNELGVFKELSIKIDVSKGAKATPNGYEITFKGKELSRIIGSFGTEIGQNEGALTTELASPNIFGRGERLTLQGAYSNFKSTDISLKLSKGFLHTRFMNFRPEISLSLFRHSNIVPVSAYRNESYGLITDFSFVTKWPLELVHSLQYEGSIREITLASKSAPFFVRENCGPRMSSLLRYILAYDDRDDTVFPTFGSFIKTTNEFSGFGGNINYMMNNTHAEINIPLFAGASAQFCSRIGILQVDKKSQSVPISNLFYIGGPMSLRGFHFGGAGPQIDGYTGGANSYWSLGMHLWAPLPYSNSLGRFSDNFRTHLFYNVGGYNSFTTDFVRSAVGVGIAYKFVERARIEMNYCVPLHSDKGDRTCKGFQFGIGCEFI